MNSVASSAGSTATMAVLVQSDRGHLNGWPSYPFDQEECHARATVAATRSQSLTVIISKLDMMGIMGMIQVLAARAHPLFNCGKCRSWGRLKHSWSSRNGKSLPGGSTMQVSSDSLF